MKKYLLLALLLTFTLLQSCETHPIEIKKEQVKGAELAYYTRGEGDPLVLIMGFKGTMAGWDPALLEILEKHFKLILFDNRGAGLSTDDSVEELTIQQMAKDTAQLIKNLGYEKAHVLGWSMGSRIALELAIEHPKVVDCLILCAPNPGGPHQAPRPSEDHKKVLSEKISQEELLSLVFPDTLVGREALAQYVSRLAGAILTGQVPNDIKISRKAVLRQKEALIRWDENNRVYDELPHILSPTLVTGGQKDSIDSPLNVKIIADRIPYAWSAYFAESGHNFLSQDHREFGNLVILFIQSNVRGRE